MSPLCHVLNAPLLWIQLPYFMTTLCASLLCLIRLLVTGKADFYPTFGSHSWACLSVDWPSLLAITHRLMASLSVSIIHLNRSFGAMLYQTN